MQNANVHFTWQQHQQGGSKAWERDEGQILNVGDRRVLMAAPASKKTLSSSGWKLCRVLCYLWLCEVWSGTLLLAARGISSEKATEEASYESKEVAAALMEKEEMKQTAEGRQTEQVGPQAAAPTNAGDSRGERKGSQSTREAAEVVHGTAHAQTTAKIEEEHSKQKNVEIVSGEASAEGTTAAQQEREGSEKEAETKTPAPTGALRGLTMSQETLEGKSDSTGVATAANLESALGQSGACTEPDTATIFWRMRVQSGAVNPPLSVAPLDDSTESQGLYTPVNPFYDALLSCGRSTFAQRELTETCVQARLERLHRAPLTKRCIDCFTASVACGSQVCRSACFLDSCAQKCLQCTKTHCRPALQQCTGVGQLPPMCVPEEATPSQEEEEDRAIGSTQQQAWTKFFNHFSGPDEDDTR